VWQLRIPLEPADSRLLEEANGFTTGRELLAGIYDGSLDLVVAPSHGSVVTWRIPIGKPTTVLIIDDDEQTRDLYRRYLSGGSYVVRAFVGDQPLIELLFAERPDVILLDVLMPGMGGWHVLETLKAFPETADIPVIVCSVLGQPDLALSLGAAQVLVKPIGQDTLLRTLQTVLHPQDSRRSTH
jgi:CheY-like chemotaxis protein